MAQEIKETPRQQALRAIMEGGSVFVGDTQYTKDNVADLPSEAEFAQGNEELTRRAVAEIDAQMVMLMQQRESALRSIGAVTSNGFVQDVSGTEELATAGGTTGETEPKKAVNSESATTVTTAKAEAGTTKGDVKPKTTTVKKEN